MDGFIYLWRKIIENDLWFEERFTKAQAWIDLLLLATHKERSVFIRGIEIKLKPGELAYSQHSLAKRWKWNRRTVRKFLDELENRGMVLHRKTAITTVISLKNYGKLQNNALLNGGCALLKSAEMPYWGAPQKNGDTDSKCEGMKDIEGSCALQKSPISGEGVHTNNKLLNNKQQQSSAVDKEFYKFINGFTTACHNNGLFINESKAVLKLKPAYYEYGDERMRLCFNKVIGKALEKKENGEKIRDLISYGLTILKSDYSQTRENSHAT